MTENGNGNGMEAVSSPLRSKKFLAFMVAEITWKLVMLCVLFWGREVIPHQIWLILLALTLVTGFVEVGYIIGQSSLDKFVRVAGIVAHTGQEVSMKGLTITAQKKETETDGPTD